MDEPWECTEDLYSVEDVREESMRGASGAPGGDGSETGRGAGGVRQSPSSWTDRRVWPWVEACLGGIARDPGMSGGGTACVPRRTPMGKGRPKQHSSGWLYNLKSSYMLFLCQTPNLLIFVRLSGLHDVPLCFP